MFGPAYNIGRLTASPASGTVPLIVQFTDTSTGTITAWDGILATACCTARLEIQVIPTFFPVNYTVTLRVTGSGGVTSRKSLTIRASLPLPLPL